MQEVRPSATACTDVHPLSEKSPPSFSLLFVPVTCPSPGALLLIDEYQPTSPAFGLREMRRCHTKSSCCRSTREGAVSSISLRNPCLLQVAAHPCRTPSACPPPQCLRTSSPPAQFLEGFMQAVATAASTSKTRRQASPVSQAVAMTSP